MKALTSPQAWYSRYLMVLVRILFGYLWLEAAAWKNPPTFGLYTGADFNYWVNQVAKYSRFTFGATFMKDVVLPNFLFFGWVIFILELALGIGLVLGLKTRVFAILVIPYTFMLYAGSFGIPNEWYWSYLLMTMVGLTLFAHDTSDSWLSVDYWLNRLTGRKGPVERDARHAQERPTK